MNYSCIRYLFQNSEKRVNHAVTVEMANHFMNYCQVTKKCVDKYSDNLQNERKEDKFN